MHGLDTKEFILKNSIKIRNEARFRHAVEVFYKINKELHCSQPFFFKYVFNESRFNLMMMICCLVYGEGLLLLTDVKNLCKANLISSESTITSTLSFLVVSGRIEISRDRFNRREVKIKITEKGIEDLSKYIICSLKPLSVLRDEICIGLEQVKSEYFLRNFFCSLSVPLLSGVTFRSINPDIYHFISKDGGRLFIVYLYMQSIKNNNVISYSLDQMCYDHAISRTQVVRLLKDMKSFGFVDFASKNVININNKFINFAEEYLSLWFSYVEFYIYISADLKRFLFR
ncbi:hypothetical protein [Klebsiella quasipneumoniae]|uniref:hypothetical protein n=1 Tax=Klebsiella quasipneumoniae TaxID=1463165 RepID=UPI00371F677A